VLFRSQEKINNLIKIINDFAGKEEITLAVTGDFLDLSLANFRDVTDDLIYFLKKLPVNKIIYIVGNHDHKIWTKHSEWERIISPMLHGVPPSEGSAYISTSQIGERSVFWEKYLSQALNKQFDVTVAYPSLHLQFGDKLCYFHHGHLVGDLYDTFSRILEPFIKDIPVERSTSTINAPLIEFIYWMVGEMGERMGCDGLAEAVYNDYDKGNSSLLKKVVGSGVDGLFPDGIVSWIPDKIEKWVIKKIALAIADKLAKDKRLSLKSIDRYASVEDTRVKMKVWIDRVFREEEKDNLVVISGHTHNPDDYIYPNTSIRLLNTGSALIEPDHMEPNIAVLLMENIEGKLNLKMVNA
jgi:predicted phosphodiesterase